MSLPAFIPQPALRTVVVFVVGLALIAGLAGLVTGSTPLEVAGDALGALGVDATWPASVATWIAERRDDVSTVAWALLVAGMCVSASEGVDNDELNRSRAALTAASGAALMLQTDHSIVAVLLWGATGLVVGAAMRRFAVAADDADGFWRSAGYGAGKIVVVVLVPILVPLTLLFAPWPRSGVDETASDS